MRELSAWTIIFILIFIDANWGDIPVKKMKEYQKRKN